MPASAALGARARECGSAGVEAVRVARRVEGSWPVDAALAAVGVRSAAVATPLLQQHGLHNALDLWLLAGGLEANSLLLELERGGISIGDRAKIRLLMGDRLHLKRLAEAADPADAGAAAPAPVTAPFSVSRALQEDSSESMSMETVAVVLSVLVGAAGYVVQVRQFP